MDEPRTERWVVPAEAAGERLDRHLAAHLDQPRNQAQRWIRDGRVSLDGEPATRSSTPLAEGMAVLCALPEPPTGDARITPEEGALSVLYEDPDLVVLDKPPGLAVHPGAGRPDGTLVHRLLAAYPELAGVGGPGRPGIVHRLDLDTSGVMVVARSAAAYRHLSRAFADRAVSKHYLAIVYGEAAAEGRIDSPIGRHPVDRKQMTVRADGRPALTHFRLLGTVGRVSLLEVDLGTGRTHQIRVHLKSVRHPLVGDPIYGEARWRGSPRATRNILRDFPRTALHAWKLAFEHPSERQRVGFEAPVPEDLAGLWRQVGGGEIA